MWSQSSSNPPSCCRSWVKYQRAVTSKNSLTTKLIRESVDSLCRDGADAQYMQYFKAKARLNRRAVHIAGMVFSPAALGKA